MMKKFRITVDGTVYNVEVEEVGGATAAPTPQMPTPQLPVEEKLPPPLAASVQPIEPVKRSQAQAAPGMGKLTAPMPGTIIKVLVNTGDKVEQGQPVVILEAMKMENKINANATGTVTSIEVSPGQNVDTGQLLLTIG